MTESNLISPSPVDDGGSDEISLYEMAAVLLDAKWLIAAIAGGIFFLVFLYALFAAPVYTPSALLQVNQKSGGLSGLETLSSMLQGSALPVQAEIQLVRSRSVLSAAIHAQHADIRVRPRHFPLFGSFIARHYHGLAPTGAWLGLSSFSWGGDRVEVSALHIPGNLYGQEFRLTVTGADAYTLSDPDGQPLLSGQTGKLETAAGNAAVSIEVSHIAARPGVTFAVRRDRWQQVLQRLGGKLEVEEQGVQSGILQVTLSGHDAMDATRLLTAIVQADVNLNRTLRAEQAAMQIQFLEDQIPTMEKQVQTARTRLAEYQVRHKVLGLSDESKALLDQMGVLDQAITGVALQRAQLEQQFAAANPTLKGIRAQEQSLQRQRAALETQVAQLPLAAQTVLQLEENLKVATGLYTGLLTSIQQLQVVKAGTVGDLNVVDLPVLPYKPSGPRRLLILVVGLLFGLFAGVVTAFVRRAFLQGVEDPGVLEARFSLPVLAVVPFSAEQLKREKALADMAHREPLLAAEQPNDIAVEALRSLRTSLQFVLAGNDKRVVCISGPVSGVGKSFIAANLARLVADAGKRVLVVDADLRRGHLYRYFRVPSEPGLSQLLSGACDYTRALQTPNGENLQVVTAGTYPPNPAELLLLPAFAAFLERAAREFELVILDAPPLLPVTDGIIVARQAGVNLLVTRSGQHTQRELEATLARYRQNGIKPDGFVFNFLRPRRSSYGYHYGYRYAYKKARHRD
ncbi:MAG: polysaccharide biosynthesis tyrosine autokinase [Gammaproteobacteria bacterium]